MNTHTNSAKENQSQSVANAVPQKRSSSEFAFQFVDIRPEAIAQRKLQEMADNSPQAKKAAQLKAMADNYSTRQQSPVQKKAYNTGLPDNLKTGIKNLSGYSINDAKVNYNSDKLAQPKAHAYAQGNQIHLELGHIQHLPHEVWHVVQQEQGRVKPTLQMKGEVNVNDGIGLEKEADMMGSKVFQTKPNENNCASTFQLANNRPEAIAQRVLQKVTMYDGWQSGKYIPQIRTIQHSSSNVVQTCGGWLASLCNKLSSCFGRQEDAERFEAELLNVDGSEAEEIKQREPEIIELIRDGNYTYSDLNTKLLPIIFGNLKDYSQKTGSIGERTPMYTTTDAKEKVYIAGMLTCSAAKVVFEDGTNGFVHVMSSTVDDLITKIQKGGRSEDQVIEVTWWQKLQKGEYSEGGREKDSITIHPYMKKVISNIEKDLKTTFSNATRVKIYLNRYDSIQLTTDDTVFSIP